MVNRLNNQTNMRASALVLAAMLSLAAPGVSLAADRVALQTLAVEGAASAGNETSLDGVVEAVRQTTLSTQVPGAIVALHVKVGDVVKAGQELLRIDARAAQLAQQLAANDEAAEFFDRRAVGKLTKQLDEQRKSAVEQLKDCAYLHRQIVWLQDRFPKAEMADVPGLCKVVNRADIEAADWSLTPGRFVGVAPADVDEDFDFEQTLRDIHLELADLNRESIDLAAKIQTNFEELGV